MKFDKKAIRCDDYETALRQAESLESEWVYALLYRVRVDAKKLEWYQANPEHDKSIWRDFLLSQYGIQIEKNISTGGVVVKRTNLKKGTTLTIGEWSKPEIVLYKVGRERWYEIQLKYFSLI